MARFKTGQTVYMGRGDKERELIVDRVIKNPLIPIHQYTFEAPNDGFACGEQSIRAKSSNPDLKLRDCFVDEDNVPTMINTIASACRHPINGDDEGFGSAFSDTDVFFRPDREFCKWLKEYANGRLIIDVGSGQGHLVRMLKMVGAKAMGIEPNFNLQTWIKWRGARDGGNLLDVNEILPRTIQDCKKLIEGLGGDKAMLVFARPCHSDFVEVGVRNMPKGMEALYITVPENLNLYNDLGMFKSDAKFVEHEGISEDKEVIYSVKK